MPNNKSDILSYLDEHIEDYECSPVPSDKRRSFFDVAMVWAGFNICISSLITGGLLGLGLPLKTIILAILVGLTIEVTYAVIIGIIGTRCGVSTSVLSRHSFGRYGSLIVSFILGATIVFWYGAQAGFFGVTIVAILSDIAPSVQGVYVTSWEFWAGVGGFVMMLTAIIGFRGLTILSNVAIPLTFLMFGLAIYRGHQIIPNGIGSLWNSAPSEPISFGVAVALVVGAFAVGAVNTSDISRYAKNPKEGTFATIFGLFATQGILFITGAVLVNAIGTANLAEAFVALGIGIPAIIFLLIAQWTTNDNNLYANALGISNFLWCTGVKGWKKWRVTIIFGLLGSIIAALGFYNLIGPYLAVLGSTIPPVAGIIIADYFLVKKQNYPKETFGERGSVTYRAISWPAIVAWLIGAYVGLKVEGWTGIPPLNAILIAFLIYLALGLIEKRLFNPIYWSVNNAEIAGVGAASSNSRPGEGVVKNV
ncbi:MAG: cytosine permease [Bacillota bacterium]